MKRILAAIDFSEVSDSVIAHAETMARAFSAPLTLLHVAAEDPEFVGYEAGPQTVRDNRAGQLHQEHTDLQARAKSLREAGLEVNASLVEGATIDTILQISQKVDADLVVLGSHGKGALRRALLGSVSQGVARKSECPVLIIPANEPDE